MNRNLMFVYGSTDFPDFFEVKFNSGNFLHLTGVKLYDQNINGVGFYKSVLSHKLSYKSLKIDNYVMVERKLSILPSLMNIYENAQIVGMYDSSRPFLKTDIITGSVQACLGFVKDNKGFYVPNTALREDLRNITIAPQKKVIAVFRKDIKREKYNENYLFEKGINVSQINFTDEILSKIDKSII